MIHCTIANPIAGVIRKHMARVVMCTRTSRYWEIKVLVGIVRPEIRKIRASAP